MSYDDYLKSEHWRSIRMEKLRSDKACVLCESKRKLHVHHGTYERRGEEWWSDLFTLCSSCHGDLHASYKKRHGKIENGTLYTFTCGFINKERGRLRLDDIGFEADAPIAEKSVEPKKERTRKPKRKRRVKNAGDPCRRCDEPVVLRETNVGKKRRPGQTYFYKSYLRCPKCGTFYMLESQKVGLP